MNQFNKWNFEIIPDYKMISGKSNHNVSINNWYVAKNRVKPYFNFGLKNKLMALAKVTNFKQVPNKLKDLAAKGKIEGIKNKSWIYSVNHTQNFIYLNSKDAAVLEKATGKEAIKDEVGYKLIWKDIELFLIFNSKMTNKDLALRFNITEEKIFFGNDKVQLSNNEFMFDQKVENDQKFKTVARNGKNKMLHAFASAIIKLKIDGVEREFHVRLNIAEIKRIMSAEKSMTDSDKLKDSIAVFEETAEDRKTKINNSKIFFTRQKNKKNNSYKFTSTEKESYWSDSKDVNTLSKEKPISDEELIELAKEL